MVLPNAPNAIRGLVDGVLRPRGISLNVLALVAQGVGCTILPESAQVGSAASARLSEAVIGPPSIWNSLVLAVPLARPATHLTREIQHLLRALDFRKSLAAMVQAPDPPTLVA